MAKKLFADALIMVGAGLAATGLWWLNPSASMICLGLFAAFIGYRLHRA